MLGRSEILGHISGIDTIPLAVVAAGGFGHVPNMLGRSEILGHISGIDTI